MSFEQDHFIHDLSNKLMAMEGKIRKLKSMATDNLLPDIENLESSLNDSKKYSLLLRRASLSKVIGPFL